MSDDPLKDAFRAVRDRYDGEHPDADATLSRALFKQRALDRKRRVRRWVLLPIAAAFVASSAWASVTGHLPRALTSLLEPERSERPAPPPPPPVNARAAAAAPAPVPAAPAPTETAAEATTPTPDPEPPAIVATAKPPASSPAKVPPPVAVTPSASASDPYASLFADAHRIHFVEKDPARAVAAWDRYLDAAPNGRFAPEARYNRALALVRLGRHAEAKKELEAFSNGAFGDYRREEARALLGALARDE